MGIEKPIDGAGPLTDLLNRIKAGLSGAMPESVGQAKGTVDVKVTVDTSEVDKAEAALDRLGGKNAPTPSSMLPPAPSTPTVLHPGEDRYSRIIAEAEAAMKDRTPENIAEAKWQKIKAEGPKAAFDKVANFGSIWGKNLGDESKDEMAGWLKAAGHKEASTYQKAYKETEEAGERIGDLAKQIKKFGESSPQAVKAAKEILGLQEKIEELGKSAHDSAGAIGGEPGALLQAEHERLKKSALAGGETDPVGKGPRQYSPHDLYRMAQNPEGAIKQFAFEGIMKKISEAGLTKALGAPTVLGEGGAMSALGGGAAGGAAVGALGVGALAAGFAAGMAFNTGQVNDGLMDAEGKIADMRTSRALGRNFDYRGEMWNKDRTRARTPDEIHAMGIINPMLGLSSAAQMGISLDNFQGAGTSGQIGGMRLGEKAQRTALDMGIDGGPLLQFLGMSMRSGEIGRGEQAGNKLLGSIHAELVEANKIGIGSQEKIGVLASLRQQEQAQTGYVSDGSIGITQGLARLLDQTKNPDAMGQQGLSILSRFGKGNKEMDAVMMGELSQGGRLTELALREGPGVVGQTKWNQMRDQHWDSISMAQTMLGKPGYVQERALRGVYENDKPGGAHRDPFMLNMQWGKDMSPSEFSNILEIKKMHPNMDEGLSALRTSLAAPPRSKKEQQLDFKLSNEGYEGMDLQGASIIQKSALSTVESMEKLLQTIAMNTKRDQTWQDFKGGFVQGENQIASIADRLIALTGGYGFNAMGYAIRETQEDIGRFKPTPMARH